MMPDDLPAQARTDSGDPLLDCLSLLARLHTHPISADALQSGLPVSGASRITPQLFVRAAERAGMTARVVERKLDRIPKLVLPAVLVLDKGRDACILSAVEDDGTYEITVPDGEDGIRKKVTAAELEKSYSGVAIMVHPARHMDDRAGDVDAVLRRSWFWGTLYHHRKDYGQVLLASVMINFFVLVSPLFVMNVYDRVVPNNAIETLWVLATGAIVVFGFDFLFRMLRAYFVDGVGKKVDVIVSNRLFAHIIGIQLAVRPASAGSFANNVREFETLRDFFTSATLMTVVDLPFSILFLFVIGWLAGPLVLVPLAAIPLVVVVGVLLQFPLTRLINANFKVASQKHGVLVEAIDGLETIKGTSAEGVLQAKWEQAVGVVAATGQRSQMLSATGVNFTMFVQQLVTIILVVVGVYLIADNKLTLGGLVASTILSGRALAPLGQIAGLLTRFQHARAAYKSLTELMAMPLDRPPGKAFLRRLALDGNIEFAKVTFKYPNAQVPALDSCAYRVNKGDRVAILGRVGSGKSTVARLIVNLYQPETGTVLVDGVDVGQIDPADLRRHIGYVPQDVKLFYGTVRDNMVMGNRRASDDAFLRAARLSGVDKIVSRHPAGFDLQVGEQGRALSGGQRQAVAIARALLADPEVLVMDEPTSHMDFATENLFVQALLEYLKGKTLVLITHKPSLLALVERIIVLEQGKVVADGPKDRVLQALSQNERPTAPQGQQQPRQPQAPQAPQSQQPRPPQAPQAQQPQQPQPPRQPQQTPQQPPQAPPAPGKEPT
jgi:ATP-binding cassette subfamily C protein LapB